ncbi:MAG: hypothetical protein LQ350_005592 [Teloschistes chrysophthalmus]|nr:MAG: hypothetical protein LQ350_005592 [Niorma chrysophthalma]
MTSKRVLLLGGHGKISLLLTPHLVSKSWHVTSVIRAADQEDDILASVKDQPGKVEVLISSLEDIRSKADAQKVIDKSKPDYVVWSAGAGGKGGPERTQVIDHDSCICFVQAAADTPSVTKFLLVSFLGSRRFKAPWWSAEEWKETQDLNNGALKNYYPAKLASDECLTAQTFKRASLQAIVLRPGRLTDGAVTGKVSLGKTKARGSVTRADVAAVAAGLIDSEAKGWFDLLEGDETITDAIERVIKDEVDCVVGEDVEGMIRDYS